MKFVDLSKSDRLKWDVAGQGFMSPIWVWRVYEPGKIAFIKSVKTWIILLYICIVQMAPLSFQAAIPYNTRQLRWAARFSGHWVTNSMFA